MGRRVHPQKRFVSWVNSVLRQFLPNGLIFILVFLPLLSLGWYSLCGCISFLLHYFLTFHFLVIFEKSTNDFTNVLLGFSWISRILLLSPLVNISIAGKDFTSHRIIFLSFFISSLQCSLVFSRGRLLVYAFIFLQFISKKTLEYRYI